MPRPRLFYSWEWKPALILQAGWVPGPVCTATKNFASTGSFYGSPYFVLLSPDCLVFAFCPLLYNTLHTNIHAPGGIQTRNPSTPSAADPRLKPLGHWDRLRSPPRPARSELLYRKRYSYSHLKCYGLQIHVGIYFVHWYSVFFRSSRSELLVEYRKKRKPCHIFTFLQIRHTVVHKFLW